MQEAYYNYAPVKRCYSEIIYTVSVPYLSEVEQDGIVHPVVDVNIKFHVSALGVVLAIKNAFANNTNMSEKYTDRPWKTLNYGSSYKRFYGLTGITFQVFGLNYYRLNDLQHDVDINIQELHTAIFSQKNNKSCGLDELSSELFKSSFDIISPFLLKLYNRLPENILQTGAPV